MRAASVRQSTPMNSPPPSAFGRVGAFTPIFRRRVLSIAVAVLTATAAAPAWALQGGEDPATLPVLIDKRYGNEGRFQAYALFSTPLVAKFTESTGAVVGANYNFNDWLGAGVVGGFFGSSEVDIVTDVRVLSETIDGDGGAPLTDLFRLVWFAGADVTFTPLYGRVSFASEYNPAFDLFLLAGGGVAGMERNVGAPPVDQPDASLETVDEVTGYVNFGAGLRFHVLEWLAIRGEYRHFLLLEPDIPSGPAPEPDERVDPDDEAGTLQQVQQVQIGVQFMF
jgi:outer membrane beta-barrel protein